MPAAGAGPATGAGTAAGGGGLAGAGLAPPEPFFFRRPAGELIHSSHCRRRHNPPPSDRRRPSGGGGHRDARGPRSRSRTRGAREPGTCTRRSPAPPLCPPLAGSTTPSPPPQAAGGSDPPLLFLCPQAHWLLSAVAAHAHVLGDLAPGRARAHASVFVDPGACAHVRHSRSAPCSVSYGSVGAVLPRAGGGASSLSRFSRLLRTQNRERW